MDMRPLPNIGRSSTPSFSNVLPDPSTRTMLLFFRIDGKERLKQLSIEENTTVEDIKKMLVDEADCHISAGQQELIVNLKLAGGSYSYGSNYKLNDLSTLKSLQLHKHTCQITVTEKNSLISSSATQEYLG